HRHPLREQERGQEVAQLAVTESIYLRVVRLALDTTVPRSVVGGPVLVPLEVRFVVLLVVGDEVAQGESVVRRDVVDRREGPTPVRLGEVARAGTRVR